MSSVHPLSQSQKSAQRLGMALVSETPLPTIVNPANE
jgi:hypothetical protein